MIRRSALLSLISLAAFVMQLARLDAADFKTRSVSRSGQFIVFCSNDALRARVTGFVEDVKKDVLDELGETDQWKLPIVISFDRAKEGASAGSAVAMQMFETPDGTKIEMRVEVGDDPAAVHLQKHVIAAVLLEYAYRDRKFQGGQQWVEPPWWITQGLVQLARYRDSEDKASVFDDIVKSNNLPPIAQFLAIHPPGLGQAAQQIDGAFAMALLQLLSDQPGGKAALAKLVREWPESYSDPLGSLAHSFPAICGNTEQLQREWTLSLAHFSALDRYKGLSADETNAELTPLLEFEIPIDKESSTKKFTIEAFPAFVKIPAAKEVMLERQAALIALSTRSNALFRPVIAEYEQIFSALARGKTHGLSKRIVEVERYRESVLHRMADIADYMNWYEATQLGQRSGVFDGFVRTAHELEAAKREPNPNDPIADYLNRLQEAIEPEEQPSAPH